VSALELSKNVVEQRGILYFSEVLWLLNRQLWDFHKEGWMNKEEMKEMGGVPLPLR
jgi:hypothetical protein